MSPLNDDIRGNYNHIYDVIIIYLIITWTNVTSDIRTYIQRAVGSQYEGIPVIMKILSTTELTFIQANFSYQKNYINKRFVERIWKIYRGEIVPSRLRNLSALAFHIPRSVKTKYMHYCSIRFKTYTGHFLRVKKKINK